MHNLKKALRLALLGSLSCLLLSGLFGSMLGKAVATLPPSLIADGHSDGHSHMTDMAEDANSFLGKALTTNLQAAQDALMAQSPDSAMQSYVVVMSDNNVVPDAPETAAMGAVGAALSSDNLLVVRGSFAMLTSEMRDYATDPVDPPNTSITSAFHIHQGDPVENGPFQYALDVTLDETGLSGSGAGEYSLTDEQAQALADGQLYMDIHTTQNRGGELRGILMPY